MITNDADNCLWSYVDSNGDKWSVSPLIWHVALYRNRDEEGNYDDRFCMANLKTAQKSVLENEKMGDGIKFWQKWHNRNITIIGCYAYISGTLASPENSLYKVSWDADIISRDAKKDW